jgi:anti-sigma B factor antagonist
MLNPRGKFMQIDHEKIAGVDAAVVTLKCENLDAGNVATFKEAMRPLLERERIVLINLAEVDFVDSSGLGALLSCLRTMNNKDGQLKLFAMTKRVQALFELVRMNRIFAIYNTREEALAAL